MYCTHCGIELNDEARYCSQCGTATGNVQPRRFEGRLTRSREDVKIAGVCSGFARYFGVDVTLVRILWLAVCIWPPGVGIIAYIICWIVMPKEPLMLPAALDQVPKPT
jgi:phage shock protein C